MSFLNEKTAKRLQTKDKLARLKFIPPKDAAKNLTCNNGKCIIPQGRLIVAVGSGRRTTQSNPFITVDNQKSKHHRAKHSCINWHHISPGKKPNIQYTKN